MGYQPGRVLVVAACVLIISGSTDARQAFNSKSRPQVESSRDVNLVFQNTCHKINRMELGIQNHGTFGGVLTSPGSFDAVTGEPLAAGSIFPKNSGIGHLWAGQFWIGAIVGSDTLVSESWWEMAADAPPRGDFRHYSTLSDSLHPELAISEEDYIWVFSDTFKVGDMEWLEPDYFYMRPHYPLPVEVTVRSCGWSYDYAEDFILFDIALKNFGTRTWKDAYFGVQCEPNVGDIARQVNYCNGCDDISGFLRDFPDANGCGQRDTLNIAWSADNDGDPVAGQWSYQTSPYRSARSVTGVTFLGYESSPDEADQTLSYNWWNFYVPGRMPIDQDFGPRKKDNGRDFRTGGLGDPLGDVNKYYQLHNGEVDYATIYTASIPPWSEWMYPAQEVARAMSVGVQHETLLSTGPFEVPPGGVLRLAIAYVGGENFHVDPDNIENLPDHPDRFYENLDFSDLAKNARWAKWIYDNPGVDTDGDGYAGEYRVCVMDSVDSDSGWRAAVAETTWYEGDGIPDWKAAGPPPAPKVWLSPTLNGIHVRFNGSKSETEKDIFTNIADFEGYRVYLGRDNRLADFGLVASYDIEDYDIYRWHQELGKFGQWRPEGIPVSLAELYCRFGHPPDPCDDEHFDPLSTAPNTPYHDPRYPDSMYYFVKHDYNASEFGVTTPIRKVYPDEPDPRLINPDSIPSNAYTSDGYLKYFEYECDLENLLSSVPYWVSVTAYDFGSPKFGLGPLETSIPLYAQKIYPLMDGVNYESKDLQVFVYPNPYRIDAGYRARHYEGRMREDRPEYRTREINFENLPAKCTIGIYSLDGDLVREINHDMPESDPNHTHDSWDVITRNTQEPVSGLYYWVVQAADGRTQIGKLVLIM